MNSATRAHSINIHGKQLSLDQDGYLLNLQDWSESVATALAAAEGIPLSPAHWEVLHLLRKFYHEHQISPATRALVNLLKRELGPDKGRSIYLMNLFGHNPAQLASRLAGLPKPENCP